MLINDANSLLILTEHLQNGLKMAEASANPAGPGTSNFSIFIAHHRRDLEPVVFIGRGPRIGTQSPVRFFGQVNTTESREFPEGWKPVTQSRTSR